MLNAYLFSSTKSVYVLGYTIQSCVGKQVTFLSSTGLIEFLISE